MYLPISRFLTAVLVSTVAFVGNTHGDDDASGVYSAIAFGGNHRLAIGFLTDPSLGILSTPPSSFGIVDLKSPESIVSRRIKGQTWKGLSQFRDHHSVVALAWSPQGGHLGIGQYDGTVAIWNMGDDSFLILGKHARCVRSILWTPDGKRVITSSDDGRVIAWDCEKQEKAIEYGDFQFTNISLAISQDGRRLAVGGVPGEVLILDVASGVVISRLHAQNLSATSVALDEKGERVFCAYLPARILAWNVEDRQMIGRYYSPQGGPTSILFVPGDSDRIIGVGGGTIQMWDADTMNTIAKLFIDADFSVEFRECSYDPVQRKLYAMSTHEIVVIAVGDVELQKVGTVPN